MPLERSSDGEDRLTGRCDRCEWVVVATGYPELVAAYQDHLRTRHPQAWLDG